MATLAHHAILGGMTLLDRGLLLLKVEGRERIPEGAAVVVFNHPRNIDPIHVGVALGAPAYFLGKKEAFDWPVIGHILRDWGGQIPLDREKGGNLGALEEAVEHLKQGHKVVLAPEGTKTHGGPVGRGRGGAARMAIAAEVPVLPAAVSYGLRPKVTFGELVDLSAWYGRVDDYASVRAATDAIMDGLAATLGQPYDPATATDYWERRKQGKKMKGAPSKDSQAGETSDGMK